MVFIPRNAIVQSAPARWNVKQAGLCDHAMQQTDNYLAELASRSSRLL